ncbi:hypothetical protein LCGC14_2075970 [marine sediment metagenome]|uniref:Uncharacterized protein n=1 Tax=marine sediment metagenome TaxID=412755 RepID=A0A0F9EH87_9ZZZZ
MFNKFITAIKSRINKQSFRRLRNKLKRFFSLPQVRGGTSPGPIFRPIFTKLETMRDYDDDGDQISDEEY